MTGNERLTASQAKSPKDWVYIGPEKAKQHKLYGPKNWLAVLAFGLIFTPLREWGDAMSVARESGVTLGELLTAAPAFDTYLTLALSQQVIMAGGLLWMMFTKHPKFRVTASAALLVSYPLMAVWVGVSGLPDAGKSLALMLLPWLIGCSVWVTYLNRSRRVRVTYEHTVRAQEVWDEEGRPAPVAAGAPALSLAPQPAPTNVQAHTAPLPSSPPFAGHGSPAVQEEDLWAAAMREFEGADRREGLWAKAFAQSGGNEAVAKARYLRERVEQLRVEQ